MGQIDRLPYRLFFEQPTHVPPTALSVVISSSSSSAAAAQHFHGFVILFCMQSLSD